MSHFIAQQGVPFTGVWQGNICDDFAAWATKVVAFAQQWGLPYVVCTHNDGQGTGFTVYAGHPTTPFWQSYLQLLASMPNWYPNGEIFFVSWAPVGQPLISFWHD